MNDVTQILSRIEDGDGRAAEELLPLVYEELRKLAAQKIAKEKPGQTLSATALVHEAYIRLVEVETAQHWHSRRHFFLAGGKDGSIKKSFAYYGIGGGMSGPGRQFSGSFTALSSPTN